MNHPWLSPNRIRAARGTPEEMARLSANKKAPDIQAIDEELATLENTIAWYTLYRDALRLEEETLETMLAAEFTMCSCPDHRRALKGRLAELQEEHDNALRDAVREKVRKRLEDAT